MYIPKCIQKTISILAIVLASNLSAAEASQTHYNYDTSGRLIHVVDGTDVTVFQFDEIGNILSSSSTLLSAQPPAITSITPTALLKGVKTTVQISGTNLLTTVDIFSQSAKISIGHFTATDTSVTAELTATATGEDTLVVKNLFGDSSPLQMSVIGSSLVLSPLQLSLSPGQNGNFVASLVPALSSDTTLAIPSSNSRIATGPVTVTIPAGGSAAFPVSTFKEGFAFFPEGNAPVAEVFVEDTRKKTSGCWSKPVAVTIDILPMTQPSLTISRSVSVFTDISPLSFGTVVSKSPSVTIRQTPQEYSTVPARPISVAVGLPPPNESTSVSKQLSVSVGVPLQSTSTVASKPVTVAVELQPLPATIFSKQISTIISTQ